MLKPSPKAANTSTTSAERARLLFRNCVCVCDTYSSGNAAGQIDMFSDVHSYDSEGEREEEPGQSIVVALRDERQPSLQRKEGEHDSYQE